MRDLLKNKLPPGIRGPKPMDFLLPGLLILLGACGGGSGNGVGTGGTPSANDTVAALRSQVPAEQRDSGESSLYATSSHTTRIDGIQLYNEGFDGFDPQAPLSVTLQGESSALQVQPYAYRHSGDTFLTVILNTSATTQCNISLFGYSVVRENGEEVPGPSSANTIIGYHGITTLSESAVFPHSSSDCLPPGESAYMNLTGLTSDDTSNPIIALRLDEIRSEPGRLLDVGFEVVVLEVGPLLSVDERYPGLRMRLRNTGTDDFVPDPTLIGIGSNGGASFVFMDEQHIPLFFVRSGTESIFSQGIFDEPLAAGAEREIEELEFFAQQTRFTEQDFDFFRGTVASIRVIFNVPSGAGLP